MVLVQQPTSGICKRGATMLLSLVVHTYSLRYWFPATIMLGTAPAYVLSWGIWRLLSTVLPARFYHKLDDRLYCIYQSMVLFFFENYTGVEVSKPSLCVHETELMFSSEGVFLIKKKHCICATFKVSWNLFNN